MSNQNIITNNSGIPPPTADSDIYNDTCLEHNSKFCLYCDTCKKNLCELCLESKSHEEHNKIYLYEFSNQNFRGSSNFEIPAQNYEKNAFGDDMEDYFEQRDLSNGKENDLVKEIEEFEQDSSERESKNDNENEFQSHEIKFVEFSNDTPIEDTSTKKENILGYVISKVFYFIKNSVNTIYTESKKIVELFERIIRNITDNEIVKNDNPKDLDFILNFNGNVVLNKTEKTRIKSDLIPTENNIKNNHNKRNNSYSHPYVKGSDMINITNFSERENNKNFKKFCSKRNSLKSIQRLNIGKNNFYHITSNKATNHIPLDYKSKTIYEGNNLEIMEELSKSKYIDSNLENFYDEYDRSKFDIISYFEEIVSDLKKNIGKHFKHITNYISSYFKSIFDFILYKLSILFSIITILYKFRKNAKINIGKNPTEIPKNKDVNFENITLSCRNNEYTIKNQHQIFDYILTMLRNDIINKQDYFLKRFDQIFLKNNDNQDFILKEKSKNNIHYRNFSESDEDSNESNINLQHKISLGINTSIINTTQVGQKTLRGAVGGELDAVNVINKFKKGLMNPF